MDHHGVFGPRTCFGFHTCCFVAESDTSMWIWCSAFLARACFKHRLELLRVRFSAASRMTANGSDQTSKVLGTYRDATSPSSVSSPALLSRVTSPALTKESGSPGKNAGSPSVSDSVQSAFANMSLITPPRKKKSGSHQTTRHVLRRLVVSGWGEIAQLNLVFWSLRATKPSAVAWRLWGRHHQVSRNYSWHPRPWRIIWISWWRLQKIRRHVWQLHLPQFVTSVAPRQAGSRDWSKQIDRNKSIDFQRWQWLSSMSIVFSWGSLVPN